MSTDDAIPRDEPAHLLCPITRAMYRDPVFVPCSGNTYEREALEKFWAAPGRARDPLTNVETRANSRVVYTNWDKRREVRDYLDAQAEDYVPSGWASRAVPAPRSPNGWWHSTAKSSSGRGARPIPLTRRSFTSRSIWPT